MHGRSCRSDIAPGDEVAEDDTEEMDMGLPELFLIALGLSMDAFAVAVCKGLSVDKPEGRHYLPVGLWFGGFQALMPLLGYLMGTAFARYISLFDHWIAFALLLIIGNGMLKEGLEKEKPKEAEPTDDPFAFRHMLPLAVATSIDAMAVGITFALLPDVNIFAAIALIGIITFALSCVGLKAGNLFGLRYKSRAEIIGGVILMLMGAKILLEHLGLISF